MRAVIATESAEIREPCRQAALSAGLECGAGDCVSYGELSARLAQASADLVLVVVGADTQAALSLIQYANTHTNLPVFAIGPVADPQQVIQVLRGGAREYLDQSRLREELATCLERMRLGSSGKHRRGQTVAVTAASPGSGVTTVASNLAFALAEKHSGQVVLAELAPSVPELAMDLDLEPRHSLAELVRDWERMDARMVRQTLVEHPAGVQVLAYSAETLVPGAVPPSAMRHTVLLLRTMYDFTVLDLGHSADETTLEAMKLAEAVVVVVRLDIPSLRLARQFIRHLADHGISKDKLRPVANRYGQRKQIAWQKAEQALGMPVLLWIPDDPATLNQALNHGQPLIQTARRAKITQSFDQLARHLNGLVAK